MNKQGKSEQTLDKLLGVVFIVVAIVTVAPMIFGSNGLANPNFTADAPNYVVTLLTLAIGFGLVYLGFRIMK